MRFLWSYFLEEAHEAWEPRWDEKNSDLSTGKDGIKDGLISVGTFSKGVSIYKSYIRLFGSGDSSCPIWGVSQLQKKREEFSEEDVLKCEDSSQKIWDLLI